MIELMLPRRRSEAAASGLAPRPAGLAGSRLGILWNSKPNADALFKEFVDRTSGEHGPDEVRWYRKPNAANGADPALLDELAEECDAALVALGD